MNMAIKYGMMKKHKMAHGGTMEHEQPCDEHGEAMCKMCHGGKMAEGGGVDDYSDTSNPVDKSMKKAFKTPAYADGGFVHEEKESGYMPDPMEHPDHMYGHEVPNQDEDGEVDMIGHIMHKRKMMAKGGLMSKGGRIANDVGEGMDADREPRQYDDLVSDDYLEQHDTGENSGDEIGDHQEDEERHDIVSQIMKSRKKKDRMPRPA